VCASHLHYCLGGWLLGSIRVWYRFTGDIGPMQPAMDCEDRRFEAPHPPGSPEFFRKNLPRDALDVVMLPGSIVLSFGWNSNGMGKTRGYELQEILLVAHGGAHNDTICLAEKKS
jgi:hypothetical protein